MYVYVYLYIIEYLILLPDTFVETILISNESNKNTSMSLSSLITMLQSHIQYCIQQGIQQWILYKTSIPIMLKIKYSAEEFIL